VTDRYCALTVVLEKDMRDDDAQGLIDAIMRLRGVLRVEPMVADPETYVAEERARQKLRLQLMQVLVPQLKEG
jgi:hypothetical protein